jgi:hypothetical protein
MKREILFRGKVDGAWWSVKPDSDAWEQFWCIADKETISQYTGLKDKNGVKIFEGDRLKLDDVFCVDKFNDGSFHMQTSEHQRRSPMIQDRVRHFQIIGNIHEETE